MMRIPVSQALRKVGRLQGGAARLAAPLSTAPPEKVEVFIDDKRVLVEPGTTVLQVR